MTPERWKLLILDCLDRIGSTEYQADTWFGKGRKISSFEELYNELLDDRMFVDFVRSGSSGLTDEQVSAAAAFITALDTYADTIPDDADSRVIFSDPNWEQIRVQARHLVAILRPG